MMINEREFGGVTVLEFLGKMTLGEGDEIMKDKVQSLIAQGRRQIVFDFRGTPYIDSSGLGELVRSYTAVSRQRGRVVLARLSKRIEDLLAVTKLLTVWEVYDTVESAVQSFGAVQLEAACPLCQPLVWTNYPDSRTLLNCSDCDASFYPQLTPAIRTALFSAATGVARTAPISHLWWITYYENSFGREAVQLTLGRPCVIAVTGRLDLWACDVVDRAWEAVPRPRRVLFDVTGVRRFSDKGRRKLTDLCAVTDAGSRAAIVVSPALAPADASADPWPTGPAVFEQRDLALAALGDLGKAPSMSATIRVKT